MSIDGHATSDGSAPANATNGRVAERAPTIRCVGVRKSYHIGDHSVEALRGVDFEITEPGFYGIMGASGSGKSTLLHLLGALDKPDAGQLFVAGRPLHDLMERELTGFRRTEIGIIFQQFNLIPTLTAMDNVLLPAMLANGANGERRDRAGSLLTRLGVGDRMKHRPDAMSGGEQQRVAIARALLYSPPVLLADEPTGNLDSASSAKLWGLLREIAQEHAVTVVMVTHEPEAATHCRKVFVLRDGRVFGQIDSEGQNAASVAACYQQLVSSA